ncbi:MAG: PIN domain-containing protein [Candidatus Aenigmarchaeota archaeon]|nr:PIN domain-containing protein [Candidatus Aenigmarchaeota archaeon]
MATEKSEKVYLDTFVFMDILSGEADAAKAKVYLEKMKEQKCAVSSILFAELAFHIRRKRGREKAAEILLYIKSLPNLEIVPVDDEIAKTAGMIRAHYAKKIPKKLTYFDCIHIATAMAAKCDKFVTGDRGFRDVKEIGMEIY